MHVESGEHVPPHILPATHNFPLSAPAQNLESRAFNVRIPGVLGPPALTAGRSMVAWHRPNQRDINQLFEKMAQNRLLGTGKGRSRIFCWGGAPRASSCTCNSLTRLLCDNCASLEWANGNKRVRGKPILVRLMQVVDVNAAGCKINKYRAEDERYHGCRHASRFRGTWTVKSVSTCS